MLKSTSSTLRLRDEKFSIYCSNLCATFGNYVDGCITLLQLVHLPQFSGNYFNFNVELKAFNRLIFGDRVRYFSNHSDTSFNQHLHEEHVRQVSQWPSYASISNQCTPALDLFKCCEKIAYTPTEEVRSDFETILAQTINQYETDLDSVWKTIEAQQCFVLSDNWNGVFIEIDADYYLGEDMETYNAMKTFGKKTVYVKDSGNFMDLYIFVESAEHNVAILSEIDINKKETEELLLTQLYVDYPMSRMINNQYIRFFDRDVYVYILSLLAHRGKIV